MINNNNMGLLLLFGWVVFTTFPLFQAFAQTVWASSLAKQKDPLNIHVD